MKGPKHVLNYYKAFGYDESSFVPCEVCGSRANDIHHVIPRSLGGEDTVDNLVSLCRFHHDAAHGIYSAEYKMKFKQIIANR